MSESLRDLVVSLSLNSDNFSRNIKSVTAQIKEAESFFKLAGAGVTKFETSTAGLSAKLGMLQQKFSLQRSAVDQYQKAMTAANLKLRDSVSGNERIKVALEQARQKYADLVPEIELARVRYDAWNSALGESHAGTQRAKAALEALETEYTNTGNQIALLEGQLVSTNKEIQNNADKVSRAQTSLNLAQAELRETESAIRKCTLELKASESAWTKVGASMTKFGTSAKTIGKGASSIGKELSQYLTAPIAALGGYAVKTSMDFEDAFAGVRKTVQMTEAEYQALDKAIRDMTLVKPASYEEIAYVAETAGQLGVAEHAVAGFTSVMTDLGAVCTDLDAEQAATGLAKLANIMGVTEKLQTTEYFERMGSTVLDLGINSASTESSIIEMAMRLAAAGRQVGLTEAQVLGYSAALSSVGIEAQMGGTAFSKALIKMEVASQTGGAALDDFARVSGLTRDAFKQLFDSNPGAAFEAFIAGLAKMDDEGMSAIATLDEIGFKEVRLRDTTLRMVNATELMNNMQTRANQAWNDNTAIHDLVAARYNTTAKRLEMLKNKVRLTASTFSGVMLPTMEDLMDVGSGWLDKLMNMDEAQRKQVVSVGLWTAAAGPLLSTFGKLTTGIGNVSTTIGKFATKVGEAGGGLKGLTSVIGSSKLAVLGLAVALGVGVYKFIDWASGAKAAREATEGMIRTAEEWANTQAKTIYDTGNDPFARFNVTKESFSGTKATEIWLNDLKRVWSDGKKESDETVTGFIDSFRAQSDAIRKAVEDRTEKLKGLGVTIPPEVEQQQEQQLAQLDKYDKEVEELLKKRQNRTLSEKDQQRLDEIIELRAQLRLELKLDENGYQTIIENAKAEIARLAAAGEQPGMDLFGDAMSAAAKGRSAVNDQLDEAYIAEYKLIQVRLEVA